MSNPTPHHYRVHLVQEGDGAVLTDGMKPAIVGGAPPQFGGFADWWSPEHLLVAAASLCFTATFRALAARGGLTIDAFTSDADATLDRTPSGFAFVSVDLRVNVRVAAGQSDLAHRLLASAKQHCVVANSLKAPVDLVASVAEELPLPA